MSKQGKILFGFGLLALVLLFAFRFVYQGWHDSMWLPLGLGVVMLIAGFVREWPVLKSFFGLRTTKHGMNMGVLILVSFAALVCVNVLAVRYDKKWDLTSARLFSLSEQSVKAVESLQRETQIILLYRAGEQAAQNPSREVKEIAGLYESRSPKIKYVAYNILRRPDLAKKYDFTSGPFAVFLEQGEQHVRVDDPTEEGFTRALMKFGREHRKVIYATSGHGERDLESNDPEGLSQMRTDLAVTYDLKPLKLFEAGNKVPDDASLVMIIRPESQFLETELQALREYTKRGGRLLIAIDPGMRHGLAQLTKSFGIEFDNDFILDPRSQMINSGPVSVIGTAFSDSSEITRTLKNGFTLFHLASSLKKAPDASPALLVEPLVGTDEKTGTVPELHERIELRPSGPHMIAMTSSGPAIGAQDKTFQVIVFGDSDWISNRLVHNNLNADLFLNSVASLMQDKDLISIRPKSPDGTKLVMTAQSFNLLTVVFLLPLPLLLFFGGGFVWWRRRSA